ncbi:MAG: hypothetical protein WC609_00480, partial [Candidatus Paceibacterota bacterium]
ARPNFAKTKRGASGGFLPQTPSSSACEPRIQKRESAEVLRNPYPQNIVSAKLSPFIRFVLLDFVQNSFELCPIDTANVQDSK